ncbi:MAG TPA: zinc-binding dehydrogenase [Anaerolineales bacterium]|nr:zinc-binding dehydrogenase [Anaerolineales bacterium]
MRAFYVDKDIPRVLLTKVISPLWPGFVWTPLSSARVTDLPDPPLPGPDWVRVQNQCCGICASDLSLLFVRADPSVAPSALPGLSRFWLGHEVVSTVTEVGPAVRKFKAGDRVIMDSYHYGAHCFSLGIHPVCRYCAAGDSRFCLNRSEPGRHGMGGGFGDGYVAYEGDVYPCPPDLTLDQGLFVEPLGIVMQAVLRRPPAPGEKVLIYGAGIIGLLTTMVVCALAPEAEITVLARYPHQAALAEKLGARHILRGRNVYSEVARLTGGKFFSAPLNRGLVLGGFDVVYDCVGNEETLTNSLRWTRARGTVMIVGLHMSPMKKVDLTLVWYSHIDLIGSFMHGHSEWNGQRKHDYERVIDFYRQGKFDIDGLITHRFPATDYKEAIRVATDKKKEKAIKVAFEHP